MTVEFIFYKFLLCSVNGASGNAPQKISRFTNCVQPKVGKNLAPIQRLK